MSGCYGLAGRRPLRHVDVAGFLGVANLTPLTPVITDGRADGVLGEH